MNYNQFLRDNSRERELALIEQLLCLTDNVCWVFCILPGFYFQFSSVTQLCPTLCNPMVHSTPGLPVHHQLPEFTQTHVHWVSDAIQPSHLLSSPSSPALNLSQLGVFSNASALHIRWPKCWSFSFNIRPSNEHSGLISFLSPVVSHYI